MELGLSQIKFALGGKGAGKVGRIGVLDRQEERRKSRLPFLSFSHGVSS